jgi:hypothetical protein
MSHLLPSLSCPLIFAFNAILLANSSLNKLRNNRSFFPIRNLKIPCCTSFVLPWILSKNYCPLWLVNFWRKYKAMFSHLRLRFISCLLPGVLPVKILYALFFPHACHCRLLRPSPSCTLIIQTLDENNRQWPSEHMSLSCFSKHIVSWLCSSRCSE